MHGKDGADKPRVPYADSGNLRGSSVLAEAAGRGQRAKSPSLQRVFVPCALCESTGMNFLSLTWDGSGEVGTVGEEQ